MLRDILILVVILMLLLSAIGFNSLYGGSIHSWEFNAGIYHSFITPPGRLDPEDRFSLNNGLSLSASLFSKNLWTRAHRTGFGLSYQLVRGVIAEDPALKSGIPDRIFHMISIQYLVQINISEAQSSMLIIDVAGRLSFVFSNERDPCVDAFFCIYPLPSLGFQAGFAYIKKFKDNWGIKLGVRPQLHTGRNSLQYPFSYGIVMDIGFSFDSK